MNAKWLFLCSASLLLCASGLFADGKYQHTKDGKTLVWNNDPQPGETATWSGPRDEDGYASGYGTLTWYTGKKAFLTGSNIPSPKYAVFARYSGNMHRGKLDGAITAEVKGKTSHATFVEGRKTGHWVAGRAPAPVVAEKKVEPVQKEPEAPGAGPSPVTQEKDNQPVAASAVKETPQSDKDDSLESLVGPLRMNPTPVASSQASTPAEASPPPEPPVESTVSSAPASPSLTASEVIGLADTEASTQGHDLGEYQLPKPRYVTEDGTWSVDYQPKNGDAAGKHFSVSVEDKTKKASIVPGR